MSPRLASYATTLVVLLSAACSEPPTQLTQLVASSPPSLANSVTTYPATGLWSAIVDGERGTTSAYRLYMPTDWNGKLVIYAHGIVAPFLPVALPVEGDGMAAIFGSQGFAVALSSYSETGLAIRDGAKRTHQMQGIFTAAFEKPDRTYLAGSSMGGFIVASLAEQYPSQYDGVLPMCGVVGGFGAELAYVLNARVLFDLFYPNVLPGTPMSVPMPSDPAGGFAAVGAIQAAATTALLANSLPALWIALIDQTSMPLPNSVGGPLTASQFGEFVITPQLLHAIFINDVVMHSKDKFPVTNVGTTYTTSSPLAPFVMPPGLMNSVNANVARVEADKAALKWIEHYGETSGELSLPTLTIHTRYDTWVPIATEAIYRSRVAAAGKDALLVQRTTEGFGHCNFTPAEIGKALADLTAWVEHGVKPAP